MVTTACILNLVEYLNQKVQTSANNRYILDWSMNEFELYQQLPRGGVRLLSPCLNRPNFYNWLTHFIIGPQSGPGEPHNAQDS